jgi:hypothetical protein
VLVTSLRTVLSKLLTGSKAQLPSSILQAVCLVDDAGEQTSTAQLVDWLKVSTACSVQPMGSTDSVDVANAVTYNPSVASKLQPDAPRVWAQGRHVSGVHSNNPQLLAQTGQACAAKRVCADCGGCLCLDVPNASIGGFQWGRASWAAQGPYALTWTAFEAWPSATKVPG